MSEVKYAAACSRRSKQSNCSIRNVSPNHVNQKGGGYRRCLDLDLCGLDGLSIAGRGQRCTAGVLWGFLLQPEGLRRCLALGILPIRHHFPILQLLPILKYLAHGNPSLKPHVNSIDEGASWHS
jgi:hypothetical protein